MDMMEIYEMALREASKERFIKKITPLISASVDTDSLLKWVDSGAADNSGVDWNKISVSNPDEIDKLISSYKKYQDKGGSRKARNSDPNKVFSDENSFYIHKNLENEYWVFVSPRNHDAAVLCNTGAYGYGPSAWCIGTTNDNQYWKQYVGKGNKFIMAVKKPSAPATITNADYDTKETPTRKYMLQIAVNNNNQVEVTGWRPCDSPDDTLSNDELEDLFGWSAEDFGDSVDDTLWEKIVTDTVTHDKITMTFKGVPSFTEEEIKEGKSLIFGETFDFYVSLEDFANKLMEIQPEIPQTFEFHIVGINFTALGVVDRSSSVPSGWKFIIDECFIEELIEEETGYPVDFKSTTALVADRSGGNLDNHTFDRGCEIPDYDD